MVFLLDSSTSIQEYDIQEFGGTLHGFPELVEFAACTVRALGPNVALDRIRVAAIGFDTFARVHFNFASPLGGSLGPRDASQVQAAIGAITYPHERGIFTDTNIHLGLAAMRNQLQASGGFRGSKLNIVLVTDGAPRNKNETALDLLKQELGNDLYKQASVSRWAIAAGSKPDLKILDLLAPDRGAARDSVGNPHACPALAEALLAKSETCNADVRLKSHERSPGSITEGPGHVVTTTAQSAPITMLQPDDDEHELSIQAQNLLDPRQLAVNGDVRTFAHRDVLAVGDKRETFTVKCSSLRSIQKQWTFAAEVTQHPQTSGYVFAKSSLARSDGASIRHFALYSNGRGLRFYYTNKNKKRRSVMFPTAVNDGKRHQILLYVSFQNVFLAVDGRSIVRKRLTGKIGDCGRTTSQCVLHLGQRQGDHGGSAWPFQGTLHTMVMVYNKVIRDFPTVVSKSKARLPSIPGLFGAKDWLPTDSSVWKAGGVPFRNGAYLFTGVDSGVQLNKTLADFQQTFSIAMRLRAVQGTGGYLVAKTSKLGTVKHVGLYISAKERDVALYYQHRGRTAAIRFPINLSDGQEYRLLLTVDAGHAMLSVDNVRIGGKALSALCQAPPPPEQFQCASLDMF